MVTHERISGTSAGRVAGGLSRRGFLGGVGAAGAVLWTGGCGYYAPGRGAPYAPWRLAEAGADPRLWLVHAATLAASPHNTQPWLFGLEPEAVTVHVDLSRSLGAMDPLGRERLIGLGCAIENLLVAARHRGLRPAIHPLSDPAAPTALARVALPPGDAEPSPLLAALARRRTHRGPYASRPLTAAERAALEVEEAPVQVHWLDAPPAQEAFRALTIEATEAIVADAEMSEASFRWFRQTEEEIARHRDGLTLDAQALGAFTSFFAKVLGRTSRETGDRYWLKSTRDVHTRRLSAFGILSTPSLQVPSELLAVGRVYQRLHLTATTLGLDMQPLNQAAERRDRELTQGLAPGMGAGARLAALVPPDRHAQMLFRIGPGLGETHHSPRRDPADTLLAAAR